MSARERLVNAYRSLLAKGKIALDKVPEGLRKEVGADV